MTSAVPDVPQVPEVPHVPTLRRAARGLGMVFAALALGYMTFVGQVLLLVLLPGDHRWLLIPLGVWVLLDVLALAGRWLCLKAKASLATKNILRASIAVNVLTLVVDTAVAVIGGLEVFGVLPPNPYSRQVLVLLQYLILASPLLTVIATVLFLFYIRGLGIALERYSLGADAMGVLVEALLIYLLVPPFVAGILAMGLFMQIWFWEEVLFLLAYPFLLLAVFLLALYPFVRYCNLLIRLRDSLLWQLDNPDIHKRKRHPKPAGPAGPKPV